MPKKSKNQAAFDAMKKPAGNMNFKSGAANMAKKGVLRQKQMGK